MKLRDYQADAVAQIYSDFKQYRKILLCMATGAGKSETVTYIVRDALEDGVPVVMVVRGRELVENLSKRLLKYKIDHSVFMADHYRYDPKKLIQVCSIDTINARKRFPHIEKQCIVVLDEAHKNYDLVFENYKTQMILGMTATPFQEQWNFDHYIKPIEAYELRDSGALVPDRIYCPNIVDTSNVKIVAGDFQRDAIEDLMTQSQIVGNIVDDYIEFGESRPAVCFAVSVEHSKLLAKRFNDSGISAVHCDAKSSAEEREKAHKGILDGSIKVICNVDIFSVGWDCPPISCVILARPTWSTIWYLQAVGRGLRSFPGKTDCIILDNAGNVFRHGGPYRIREITLDRPEKGARKKRELDESITTCKECYHVFPSEEKECPECGWTRPPREIKQVDGKLTAYVESPQEKERRLNIQVQKEYHQLEYIQRKKGLKPNFAFYKIKEKFGNDGLKTLEKYLGRSLPAFLYK